MKRLIWIFIVTTLALRGLIYLFADRPTHNITFAELKCLHKGMTYKEVTNAIGLPDEVQSFSFAQHVSGCMHPKEFEFTPSEQTDIGMEINSIYADSTPCCAGMKESWINRSPSFFYGNKNGIFHDLKMHVEFTSNGEMRGFTFVDKGLFSKTDNGLIYSLSGRLWWDEGKTPVYNDGAIEKAIRKL